MRKNMVELGMTHDNTTHARCMLDNSGYKHHSEYVVLIAFARQQWLRERSLLLGYSTLPVFLELIVCACFLVISGKGSYILMKSVTKKRKERKSDVCVGESEGDVEV
jgi:hypothetical protein